MLIFLSMDMSWELITYITETFSTLRFTVFVHLFSPPSAFSVLSTQYCLSSFFFYLRCPVVGLVHCNVSL
ncbi:hypothetical protein C8R48DRAFT_691466, partial [Suillus tomentosus]